MRRASRVMGKAAGFMLTAALVACAPGGSEPDSGPTTGPGDAPTDSDDGEPVTLPPEFLECGDPTDLDEQDGLTLATLDLSAAQWEMPGGFRETFSYYEDNPVENLVSIWVAEPEQNPVVLNVLNVVVYDGLDWGDAADGCRRVPLDAVKDRLAGYREQIGAEPLNDAEMTLLAGHPAVTQELSLPSYSYVGYWLFSTDQLLHLYCQWTEDRSMVQDGCADLIESLQVD